jgi:hypothetical protein
MYGSYFLSRGSCIRMLAFSWAALVGWMWLAVPLAGAQSISVDNTEYKPGETVTVQAQIPGRRPIAFYLVQNDVRSLPLPLYLTFNTDLRATFTAPFLPGVYDVHMVDMSHGLLAKTMPFTVKDKATAVGTPAPGQQSAASSRNERFEQKAGEPGDLEGAWYIEWHDYPQRGQITTAAAVLRRGRREFVSRRNDHDGTWLLEASVNLKNWGGGTPEFTAAGLQIKWGYGFLGHWGGASRLRRSASPDVLEGSWEYSPNGGREVWRRAVPEIKQVTFISDVMSSWVPGAATPARVEGTSDSLNRFGVKVYGKNLWAYHFMELPPGLNIENPFGAFLLGSHSLKDGSYVFKEDGAYAALAEVPKVIGFQTDLVLQPQFRPGKKTLQVHGLSVPFEVVIKGAGAETPAVDVRVILEGTPGTTSLDEIPPAVPFHIEAEYSSARAAAGGEPVVELKLEEDGRLVVIDADGTEHELVAAGEGPRSIKLRRISDRIYRSPKLKVVPLVQSKVVVR